MLLGNVRIDSISQVRFDDMINVGNDRLLQATVDSTSDGILNNTCRDS